MSRYPSSLSGNRITGLPEVDLVVRLLPHRSAWLRLRCSTSASTLRAMGRRDRSAARGATSQAFKAHDAGPAGSQLLHPPSTGRRVHVQVAEFTYRSQSSLMVSAFRFARLSAAGSA